jgi:hypothetical protein
MNNLIETQYNTHFKRASLHKCGIETGYMGKTLNGTIK